MNVTVEDLGNLKRKLSVEIPLNDVQAAYDEVYAQIRTNVRVKGFRPGKFPRALAEKRFKALMEQEATRNLVPKYFDQALKEQNLSPATEPNFDNLEFDKNKPLKFDVRFEIVPPFTLPELSGFKLDQKPVDVAEQTVDERLQALLRSRAKLVDKDEGVAEAGDTVTFDYTGTIDGAAFDGGTGKNQTQELGSGRLLPEFDKQLLGTKSGAEKSFEIVFPQDYPATNLRNKQANFQVTVHNVQRSELPELNAEFLKQFGEIATVDDLKARIREQLTAEAQRKQRQEMLEDLAGQIKGAVSFDVPEQLVEKQLHDFEHRLEHDDPEAHKDEQKLATLKAEQAPKIRDNLRLQFVLDEFAKQHHIEVSKEEVQQRFMVQAYMLQQNPAELVESAFGQRMLVQIQQDLAYNKTLEHLADEILGPAAGASAGPAHAHEHTAHAAAQGDPAGAQPAAAEPQP